jgi:hypothetical protein
MIADDFQAMRLRIIHDLAMTRQLEVASEAEAMRAGGEGGR